MAEVTIRDLRKSYGAVEVIHGVDVDIADGEFVVLVGPSGCGKSTLLRMIAGLEGITSGTIAIGDKVVNNLPPSERDIAMVFQNYALYPHKTVASNMAFALRMRRMDKAEIADRVERAAEILGLTPYLDRYPRALVGRPAAARRDGPRHRARSAGLSVRRTVCRTSTRSCASRCVPRSANLHQRLKTTTVYVTHDQIEAMTMADKIVVMQDGHIEQVGSPLELYDRPANTFVAGFIGSPSMNMLPGSVRANGGAPGIAIGDLVLPMDGPAGLADGQPVTVGIRPENLTLADAGLPATVSVIEPTGAETHVVLRAEGQDLTAVFRDRTTLRPGETVHLTARPDAILLFDHASGARLS